MNKKKYQKYLNWVFNLMCLEIWLYMFLLFF
jgi:hypothetical protein